MNQPKPSAEPHSLNATMRKFGAPQTIIRQYQYWSVMLRPAQATLGALVLAAHEPAQAFSALSPASFAELHTVTGHMEFALAKAFQYDKINYLMLMMVDPDVHFHVIPRYEGAREYGGMSLVDAGWPGPPRLDQATQFSTQMQQALVQALRAQWGRA